MANRGTPIPFRIREEIRYHAENRMPKSMIARVVGVSRPTVIKYARKFLQSRDGSR